MNTLTEAIANAPTGLFTLLAAAIGLVGAFAVQRSNSKRAAYTKFRSAVLDALAGLYPIPSNWPKERSAIREELKSRFPALQAAVTEFSHALPKRKRTAFDEAWSMYRLGKDGRTIDQQDYWQYVPTKGISRTTEGEMREYDNTNSYQDNFKKALNTCSPSPKKPNPSINRTPCGRRLSQTLGAVLALGKQKCRISKDIARAKGSSGDLRQYITGHLRVSLRRACAPWNHYCCWLLNAWHGYTPRRESRGGCRSCGGPPASESTRRHSPFVKPVSSWVLFRHTAVGEMQCYTVPQPKRQNQLGVFGNSRPR